MGLFTTSTHKKTVNYGQPETNALQPGLFRTWMDIWGGQGNPYLGILNKQIQDAYQRASQEAGSPDIQSEVARRGRLTADQLIGAMGVAGQQNLLNTAGQQAGYLGALTAARPSYSFDASTPWSNFMSGLNTVGQMASLAGTVVGALPMGAPPVQPPVQPLAVSPYLNF